VRSSLVNWDYQRAKEMVHQVNSGHQVTGVVHQVTSGHPVTGVVHQMTEVYHQVTEVVHHMTQRRTKRRTQRSRETRTHGGVCLADLPTTKT
jgi:hypothetical protein